MRKVLAAIIFSTVLSLAGARNASSQTTVQSENTNKVDHSFYFTNDSLKYDYRQAAIAAYVDVKEIVSVASSDDRTDCVNFTGKGYCSFFLRAEVKEVYKGKVTTKTVRFSESGEAQLIKNKDRFLGEKVVFLEKFVADGKTHWQVIENSTRWIEYDILAKMRKIAGKKLNEKN